MLALICLTNSEFAAKTMNSIKIKTVREISRDWGLAVKACQKPPTLDLGNLLDDFRKHCRTPEEKMALVADLPELVINFFLLLA